MGGDGTGEMRRRDFVQRLPVVSAGLAVMSTGTLTACGGTAYVTPTPSAAGLSFRATALAGTGDVFLQTPAMERPVYVRRLDSGELSAVLASCTHRGCQPEPVGDRLTCPCHGSEFSFTGDVLAGPADRALIRYEVVEEGDRIVVRVEERGS